MDLQRLEEYLAQAQQQNDAEEHLKAVFSADEFAKIRTAVFNIAWRGGLNLESYVFGLRWVGVMSNDKKSFQEIINALSEIPRGFMLEFTEKQQAAINWLRGNIEELPNGKYRLVTDYREESPSYEFEAAELDATIEKAAEDYADWDES